MKWHCPICRKATDSQLDPDFPFCGEHCRLIDLGQWADERYVIPEPLPGESLPHSHSQNDDSQSHS